MILPRSIRSVLASLLAVVSLAAASRRHDPLTEKEVDEIREAAQDADQRFKLYIKFTQARFLALEQVRVDPNLATGRGERLHDLLEDIATLVGEINDNVDAYSRQNADLRKPLGLLIPAVSDWQLRLRTLKEATSSDPQMQRESKDFYFSLDNAIDAVNSLAENARDTLSEQNEAHAKKRK